MKQFNGMTSLKPRRKAGSSPKSMNPMKGMMKKMKVQGLKSKRGMC